MDPTGSEKLVLLLHQASKVALDSSRCHRKDSAQQQRHYVNLNTLETALASVATELPLGLAWQTACNLWDAAWVCSTNPQPTHVQQQVAAKMEQIARQRYNAGQYKSAEVLLCAAMSCCEAHSGGQERQTQGRPTQLVHLEFDVWLHRFGCALRLGLPVLAANLQRKLLEAHHCLQDAAASRSMISMMLTLGTTVDNPTARLRLLRLALHVNLKNTAPVHDLLHDTQRSPVQCSNVHTGLYLDAGLAIKTLQALAGAHLDAGEGPSASDAAYRAWALTHQHAMQHGVDASDMLVWAIHLQVDTQHKERCVELFTHLQHGSGICGSLVGAPPPDPALLNVLRHVAASNSMCDILHTVLPQVMRTLGHHAACAVQCAASLLQPVAQSTAWSAHTATLVECTLDMLREETVTTSITRDPHQQATCYTLVCNTAMSIIGLIPPHYTILNHENAHACVTAAQQLLQCAMHVAPTPGERAVAALHVAACLGLQERWEAAQEYINLHDQHQVDTPADTHLLLHLHAGCYAARGLPPDNNTNMHFSSLPLDVLQCAMRTMVPPHALGMSDPNKVTYILRLLIQGFLHTPELQLAGAAPTHMPAQQLLQLWQAMLALMLKIMEGAPRVTSNKSPGRCDPRANMNNNNTSDHVQALLPHVAQVALDCSKWIVKSVGAAGMQKEHEPLRGPLSNVALLGYHCGLRALQCNVPRAAVPLLTAAAATYGLLGGYQHAACKKTALLVALEASFLLPRPPPGMLAILNLASNIQLGPLALEDGGRLLESLMPQLHCVLATELRDETMQLDALAAAVNTDAIDPPRLANIVLMCGLHMTQRVAVAACEAMLHVTKVRGAVCDLPMLVGVVDRVLKVVDKGPCRLQLLQGVVEVVEHLHQKQGGPPLPHDVSMQWLIASAEGPLRMRLMRCVGCGDSAAPTDQALTPCVSSATDSLLGSLADEMGV